MVSERSLETRKAIFDAVIEVLASEGFSRVTHRKIAQKSGRALSSTSYHFDNKDEILCEVADFLIKHWQHCLESGAAEKPSYAAARHEIFLAAAWTPQLRTILSNIFDPLLSHENRAHIDRKLGLQFISSALGQSGPALIDLLASTPIVRELPPLPPSGKSARSRAQILNAAIGLMTAGGAGALSYRTLAEATGAAQSAPAYHFGSIEGLISAAQAELFRASRDRYRSGWVGFPKTPLSPAGLADVTTAIFTREVTEFAQTSAAHYSVWLEASRSVSLRDEVRLSVAALARAWTRRIAHLGPATLADGLNFQAHFIGALLRIIACGSRLQDLAHFRADSLTLLFELSEN